MADDQSVSSYAGPANQIVQTSDHTTYTQLKALQYSSDNNEALVFDVAMTRSYCSKYSMTSLQGTPN